MLRPSRALALALSFVILGGCVSAPVMLERPAGVPVAHHAAPSPLIAPRGMHTMALLDDAGSVQFVQNFGGGGVGVGLMLGPLGVAANAAAIRKTTERETALLKGRFTVDPQQRFAAVAAAQGFALAGTPDGARVSPYLAVIRADDERVLVGASLLVDHAPGGQGWRSTYAWQSDLDWAIADVADGLDAAQQAALEQALDTGLTAMLALYRADLEDRLVMGDEVRFVSDFASPRFRFQLTGKQVLGHPADRVVVRIPGATFSLPASRVSVTPTTPARVAAGAG